MACRKFLPSGAPPRVESGTGCSLRSRLVRLPSLEEDNKHTSRTQAVSAWTCLVLMLFCLRGASLRVCGAALLSPLSPLCPARGRRCDRSQTLSYRLVWPTLQTVIKFPDVVAFFARSPGKDTPSAQYFHLQKLTSMFQPSNPHPKSKCGCIH